MIMKATDNYEVRQRVTNPKELAEIMRKILLSDPGSIMQEHFWVIGFGSDLGIEYIELVALGTLDGAMTTPREVFRTAILKSVRGIAIAHNHPSGYIKYSGADLKVTEQMVDAGKIIGIPVHDHLIITHRHDGYFSFKQEKLI